MTSEDAIAYACALWIAGLGLGILGYGISAFGYAIVDTLKYWRRNK